MIYLFIKKGSTIKIMAYINLVTFRYKNKSMLSFFYLH